MSEQMLPQPPFPSYDERAAYEAWFRGFYGGSELFLREKLFKHGDRYFDLEARIAWEAWKARWEVAASIAGEERREMQETEQRLRAEIARLQAVASRAVPDGWKLVAVNAGFDDLIYWLDRCEGKGHLEYCPDLKEPWEAFDYQLLAAAPQPAAPVLDMPPEYYQAQADGFDTGPQPQDGTP